MFILEEDMEFLLPVFGLLGLPAHSVGYLYSGDASPPRATGAGG